jgi:hypothetical protein
MFPEYGYVLVRFSRYNLMKEIGSCRIYVG